ncbi:MAG: transposase zinc-binding domain-containing protein, partial [Armatimonadetes bacterium]|nr:transposase zinc-binding domain-containing protein [Armatimonadota bacterium]
MEGTAPVYRQRRAQESPLWALVDEHGETVRRQWSERFEEQYGPWRAHWDDTISGFLECGDLECGFARVRCPACGLEFHLPFSCKRRMCPSCEARRRVEWADHVVDDVLPDLAYRQLVFTLPKIVRRVFMRERALRGELMRTAYAVLAVLVGRRVRSDTVHRDERADHRLGELIEHHPDVDAGHRVGSRERPGTAAPPAAPVKHGRTNSYTKQAVSTHGLHPAQFFSSTRNLRSLPGACVTASGRPGAERGSSAAPR